MRHPTKYTAVILAGGQARRLGGKHKTLAMFRGKTLLEHQLEILKPLFQEILLIANDPKAFQNFSQLMIRTDIIPDKGPLGGIHSAMHHASCPSLFVVAGDMPFLQREMIRQQIILAGEHPGMAIVPKPGEKTEPLHAIYPLSLLNPLDQWLRGSRDHSVRSFLEEIPVYYWGVQNSKPFVNINTPEELRRYEAD